MNLHLTLFGIVEPDGFTVAGHGTRIRAGVLPTHQARSAHPDLTGLGFPTLDRRGIHGLRKARLQISHTGLMRVYRGEERLSGFVALLLLQLDCAAIPER
jgi:hypothetical protein